MRLGVLGTYTGVSNGSGQIRKIGVNVPGSKIANAGYVIETGTIYGVKRDHIFLGSENDNDGSSDTSLHGAVLSPPEARSIDKRWMMVLQIQGVLLQCEGLQTQSVVSMVGQIQNQQNIF